MNAREARAPGMNRPGSIGRLAPAFVLALGFACDRNATTTGRDPAPDAAVAPPNPIEEETCVDRWLAAHGLDPFGEPIGTVHAGGTPLFDESTGKHVSRLDYVYASNPDAAGACRPR